MAQSKSIYLGINGSVMALNPATGEPRWVRKLKSCNFVNVVLDGSNLLAATSGEIYCLDPETGVIRWHNPLKGYGWGLVTLAGEGIAQNAPVLAAEKHRRDEQQQSAAASAV